MWRRRRYAGAFLLLVAATQDCKQEQDRAVIDHNKRDCSSSSEHSKFTVDGEAVAHKGQRLIQIDGNSNEIMERLQTFNPNKPAAASNEDLPIFFVRRGSKRGGNMVEKWRVLVYENLMNWLC
jgi:hypothetical protein